MSIDQGGQRDWTKGPWPRIPGSSILGGGEDECFLGPVYDRNGVKMVWILVRIRNYFIGIGITMGQIESEGGDGDEMGT